MESEESSIERLKRSLNSRNEDVVPKEKRTPVSLGGREVSEVPTDWDGPKTFEFSPEVMAKKNNSFFNKFLIGSLVFFFLALGAALFIFFGGLNMISSNNLDVQITAPSSISSGEELDMGLSIVNANRTDLEGVALFVEYPQGAQSVGEDGKALSHEKIDLGVIPKGDTKDYTIQTLLFGEKDVVKTFIFRLEYRVKGSNAVFSKEKTYDVVIGSSPILLNVKYPKEVNSGQSVTLSIEITSNSSVPIKNSLIKLEYPYGFTYKTSNMTPLRDNSVWNIGDLKNGDKKTLSITGILVGQNLEDRSFRISAGKQSAPNASDFETALAASTVTLGIRKSFFDLSLLTQGGVSEMGQTIPVSLKWQNTLPDKVVNARVTVTVTGSVLDKARTSASNGGFYESVNNNIVWDKNSTPVLNTLLPGDSSQVSFNISSIGQSAQSRGVKNPHIDLHVVMTGDRVGSDGGQVSSTEDTTIKIASTMSLVSRTWRDMGPFANSGPIPPRADIESTYTVTWTITNTNNDLKDTVVTTTLPAGVVWKAQTSPVAERITFDPDTKVITWNLGAVSAGSGFTNSPKEVSFKLGVVPSQNQIGNLLPLTGKINARANDTYAEIVLSAFAEAATTRFSDPSFINGKDIVTN